MTGGDVPSIKKKTRDGAPDAESKNNPALGDAAHVLQNGRRETACAKR